MSYITNEQKTKNNTTKSDAQFKHYNALAKADYKRNASAIHTSRGSMNGNG